MQSTPIANTLFVWLLYLFALCWILTDLLLVVVVEPKLVSSSRSMLFWLCFKLEYCNFVVGLPWKPFPLPIYPVRPPQPPALFLLTVVYSPSLITFSSITSSISSSKSKSPACYYLLLKFCTLPSLYYSNVGAPAPPRGYPNCSSDCIPLSMDMVSTFLSLYLS